MTNLAKNLREFRSQQAENMRFYSAQLGVLIGGQKVVEVTGRPGFVYVRLQNNPSELIQAWNDTVSPVYDLPVLVVRDVNYYRIYGRDSNRYSNWVTSSNFVPRHGGQHEFDRDNNGGGDIVFVHGEQFYPLLVFPSGSDGAGNVLIAPYRYYYEDAWRYSGNTGSSSMLAYKPTGSNNAKLVLITLENETGNYLYYQSSEFSESVTGAYALTSYIPSSFDDAKETPLSFIRMVTGTSKITWDNIYDVRPHFGGIGGGGGGVDYTEIVVISPGVASASFPATDAGLDSAFAACVDESVVYLPDVSFSSEHTLPQYPIKIIGTGRNTVGDGSYTMFGNTFYVPDYENVSYEFYGCNFNIDDATGVIGRNINFVSGSYTRTVLLEDCDLYCRNAGNTTNRARNVDTEYNGGGYSTVIAWNCSFYAGAGTNTSRGSYFYDFDGNSMDVECHNSQFSNILSAYTDIVASSARFYNCVFSNRAYTGLVPPTPYSSLTAWPVALFGGDVGTTSDGSFYFGSPLATGTWRIVRDGANLAFQLRATGAWYNQLLLTP